MRHAVHDRRDNRQQRALAINYLGAFLITEEQDGVPFWKLGARGYYLYFSIDDSAAFDCRKPMVIEVTYLDQGEGMAKLQYDSRKGPYSPVKPFKAVELIRLTNSGKWKTARVVVDDARFANKLNAASDFRLELLKGTLPIRSVKVYTAEANAKLEILTRDYAPNTGK